LFEIAFMDNYNYVCTHKHPMKIHIIVTVLLCLLFVNCLPAINNDRPPQAEQGVLDVTNWDFSEKGIIPLDGEWEFYWNRLYTPEDFMKGDAPVKTGYIPVPLVWNKYKAAGKELPAFGYATFRLVITNNSAGKTKALKIPDMFTAYALWINGVLIARNGTVGRVREQMRPEYRPQVAVIEQKSDVYELVVQVSNFQSDNAGIWTQIFFGEREQIVSNRENRKAYDLFVVGILLVMGIYHLSLYLLGKKERAILFFGLFCFAIIVRGMTTGERILLNIIPYIPWPLLIRLELCSGYMALPIFYLFIANLFPKEMNKTVLVVIEIVCSLLTIICIICPTPFIYYFVLPYQLFLIIACLYGIVVIIHACIKKRAGAVLLVSGIVFFALTIINDILYSQFIIQSVYLIPYGFLAIILFAFALNVKYIRAEEKNMALLNAMPDSMIHVNSDGMILDYKSFNHDELFKVKYDLEGRNIDEVFPPGIVKILKRSIREVSKVGSFTVYEHKLRIKGRSYYYEIRVVRKREKEMISIFRDITEKKYTEEKLLQAAKLSSLGTIVSGVAHEINNPNNSILLTAQALEADIASLFELYDEFMDKDSEKIVMNDYTYKELADELPQSVLRIKRNSERIKSIVDDLKRYSSKEIGKIRDVVDINSVVEASIRLMENQIKKATHNFNVRYGENIPTINGFYQRLEQVLVNLIQNACQALTERTQSIFISTEYDKRLKRVIIMVEDEGMGMDETTKSSICDPFFTTKKVNGGTGLGLSISAKIIRDHGGTLEFDSAVGAGTNVKVILPVKKTRRVKK
jgi:signal transduction histidine kinase